MKLRKIISLVMIAMSFAIVSPAIVPSETSVTKTETVNQPSQELIYNSNFTKAEKKAFKAEKKEKKKKNKKGDGLIFGLGILGVALIVLLCFAIF